MYIKTKQAAVWVGNTTGGMRASRPPRIERWATRPLQTREGIARALRFDGTYARVLLEAAGRRHWVPLTSVMSDSQAEHWIRTGFRRGG